MRWSRMSAGVDWFGRNLQAEFRGLRGALRCQRVLWRPLGAEFRGNGHRTCCHDTASQPPVGRRERR